jgi:hypothetical protein
MEKILIEMTKPQFLKEMSTLKSMTKKMAAKALEIGDEKGRRIQLVMKAFNEMKKSNLDIDTLETVSLVHDTETGDECIRMVFNKPTDQPKLETPVEPNATKRMDEVLRRMAGWLFTMTSGEQPFNKEDADRAIEDINYAIHGAKKPPLEYRFVTGKEATAASSKVFWRLNEGVIRKLIEACEFAKAELECSGAKGENYKTLVDALETTYKHFGLKGS